MSSDRAFHFGRDETAHVAGEDEDGDPIIDGYEPARDPDLDAAEIFAGAIGRKF
jgi:hypothetical protein